jgi:shikimate kinase
VAKEVKIVLVGLPASGKSYLGRLVSEKIGLRYLDLDEAIENEFETDIATLWISLGEKSFRKLEGSSLGIWLLNPGSGLMAAGGGVMSVSFSRKLIKQYGVSIFIDTPVDVIAERLFESHSERMQRPMFKDLSGQEEILDKLKKLDKARREFFERADYRIAYQSDAAAMVDDLSAIISKCINKRPVG